MLLIITISTFICISLVMMGAYWLFYRPQSAATERLKQLGDRAAGPVTGSVSIEETRRTSEFAERIASPLNRLLPPSAAEVKKLQKQLMQAGFRRSSAPVTFRALQFTAMAGFPALVALACALLARPLNSAVLYILFAFV
ncbi:MAG TPA: hypothetical protein VFH15_04990, partial [Pyrinomonadaceae bacterium]|nr:hypothetical protein [Pyrinomonadaceae bacterium]